jgi:hypothetical protein
LRWPPPNGRKLDALWDEEALHEESLFQVQALGHRAGNLLGCVVDDGYSFNAQHGHIRPAEKAEDAAPIRFLEADYFRETFRIDSAQRENEHRLLAGSQVVAPVLSVQELPAEASNLIASHLYGEGQAKIVISCGDASDLGHQEYVIQGVGEGNHTSYANSRAAASTAAPPT